MTGNDGKCWQSDCSYARDKYWFNYELTIEQGIKLSFDIFKKILGKNFDTRTWENIRVNSSGVEYSTVSTLLFELCETMSFSKKEVKVSANSSYTGSGINCFF
jgi:hypothetical protein